jgi:hypothetical protein
MDENQAIELICERLCARFPDVPPATVRIVVQEVHATLIGRVRDYIPVLVERAAKERLVSMAHVDQLRAVS